MDLVDREEVRQTLYAYIPGFRWKTIDKIVDDIPSAQPEIIRCKDCRKWQTVNCPFFSQYKSVMPNEEQYCSLAERRTDG